MKRLKYLLKVLLIFILVTISFWLIWSVLFNPITTIFNVTAKSERVSYRTTDTNNSRLVFNDATLASEDSILYRGFEGSFELDKEVNITIERISFGDIYITISCQNCKSVGQLFNGSNGELYYTATNFIDIVIPNIEEKAKQGQTFLFNIDGGNRSRKKYRN